MSVDKFRQSQLVECEQVAHQLRVDGVDILHLGPEVLVDETGGPPEAEAQPVGGVNDKQTLHVVLEPATPQWK